MTKESIEVPPNVMKAIETLETASSPAELGRAYQTVLEWRQKTMLWPSKSAWGEIGAIVILTAAILALTQGWIPPIELSDYWRGALFGVWVAMLILAVRDWLSPKPRAPASLRERVEAVIERWRHAVPAMRDLPK